MAMKTIEARRPVHIGKTDLAALRKIVAEIQERIARFGQGF